MADTIKKITQRKAKKEATRNKILKAAKAAFAEAGYDFVSIRELATAAGMSTGAVFSNFTDKADLFEAATGRKPPIERVVGWLRGIAAAEDERGENARQLLVDLVGVDA